MFFKHNETTIHINDLEEKAAQNIETEDEKNYKEVKIKRKILGSFIILILIFSPPNTYWLQKIAWKVPASRQKTIQKEPTLAYLI